MSLKKRASDYYDLNLHLVSLSERQLRALLKTTNINSGWGLNQTVKVSGRKIFVKRVPLTQYEYDRSFSTKNHFQLPTYYSFGVGSAGFGAYRELIGHLKTTNWVLNEEIVNFPLMYHYRIIPRLKPKVRVEQVRHREYIKRWNGSKNIGRYILARNNAPYELIIFLEYFPHTARSWILENTGKFNILVKDIKALTAFLKKKGILHFDLHLSNIVTDGKSAYVTDFGLCLDRSFEFSKQERRFFNEHFRGQYDYNEFLSTLGYSIFSLYDRLPKTKKNELEKQIGIKIPESPSKALTILFENLKVFKNTKYFQADNRFLSFLGRNKNTILKLADFYSTLRLNPKKNTPYPKI